MAVFWRRYFVTCSPRAIAASGDALVRILESLEVRSRLRSTWDRPDIHRRETPPLTASIHKSRRHRRASATGATVRDTVDAGEVSQRRGCGLPSALENEGFLERPESREPCGLPPGRTGHMAQQSIGKVSCFLSSSRYRRPSHCSWGFAVLVLLAIPMASGPSLNPEGYPLMTHIAVCR
jgi:hypothetical protein